MPKKYLKTIKYEDLISSTEDIMKDVCKFLKIKFNPCLLSPKSYDNKNYYGNSFDQIKSIGLSKRNINNWKKELIRILPQRLNFIYKTS